MSNLIKRRPFWDLVFSLTLMLGMVAVLVEAGNIKASPFDELGSGFFPKALAMIIIILSIPVAVRSLIGTLRKQEVHAATLPDGSEASGSTATALQVILISVLTVVYVGGIAFRLLPFSVLTAALLTLGILVLNGGKLHRAVWIIPGSIIFGLLMEYIFTKIFIMDLPAFPIWF